MSENFRHFDATDPFGRTWHAEFRWQQNAISIRHADAVDCKYYLTHGEERREQVVALRLPDLLAVAALRGRDLTDAWCSRLAGRYLQGQITTWSGLERTLATVSRAELEALSLELQQDDQAELENARLAH